MLRRSAARPKWSSSATALVEFGPSLFTFETFALGTLGCILALGLVGNSRGRKVRDAVAPVSPTAELIND